MLVITPIIERRVGGCGAIRAQRHSDAVVTNRRYASVCLILNANKQDSVAASRLNERYAGGARRAR
jgi:hypothetical protein